MKTFLVLLLSLSPAAVAGEPRKKPPVPVVAAEVASEGMIRSEVVLEAAQEVIESQTAQKSVTKKLRVISDMHIGGCWFAIADQQKRFMDMLEGMADGSDKVDELVILGDLFEFALVPINQSTVYPTDMFSKTDVYGFNVRQLLQKAKRIADQGTKIYLVRGNHDEWLNKDMMDAGFGDSVKFMEDGLSLHGIWFEHGHIPDTCCHTTYKEDGTPVLPIGYFITRMRATTAGPCKTPGLTGVTSSKGRLEKGMDGQPKAMKALERQLMQNSLENMDINEAEQVVQFLSQDDNFLNVYLLGAVNGALNTNYEKAEETTGVMITGADNNYIKWGDEDSKISVYDVLMEHKDDIKKLLARYGKRGTAERFLSTLTDYTHWARHDTQHEVVMLGHTHMPMLAKLRRLDPQASVSDEVTYVNTGGWVQDGAGTFRNTYVDVILEPQYVEGSLVQLDKDAGVYRPTKVQMWEYPESKPRHVQEVRPQMRVAMDDDGVNPLHPVQDDRFVFQAAATRSVSSLLAPLLASLFALLLR